MRQTGQTLKFTHQSLGGHIAAINDAADEQDWLYKTFGGYSRFWIG